MRFRSALVLLTVATATPLLLQSLFSAMYVYNRENQSVVSAAKVRNRATLDAVDAELRGAIGVLQAMATLPSLERGDFRGFHRDSRVVLGTQPAWENVLLQSADGGLLSNARSDWKGAPEHPPPADERSFLQAVRTMKPAIGDLSPIGVSDQELGIAVRVPVVEQGQVSYVISALLGRAAFQQLLVNQDLPRSWASGIVGSDDRMIARVPEVERGRLASPDFVAATRGKSEGWYRGQTLDGADAFTAFSRSQLTGWAIGYAIPAAALLGNSRDSATFLMVGTVLSIGFALILGTWLTRRMARPITTLAGLTGVIGKQQHLPLPASGIHEVEQLASSLAQTSDSLLERDHQLRSSKAELEKQAAELKEKNANRTRFLAVLSHELRNPLAPLRTGIAVLKLRPDGERRIPTLEMMERQISNLTRLIDDLLDAGRVERGHIELKRKPVDLAESARHAVEAASALASARRHQLHAALPTRGVWVEGDAARLEQVVGNVLTNAIKYTPPGGTIEVRLASAGADAVLEVADTGIGFAPEDGDRIFEMFTRLQAPDSLQADGLGLGLPLARALMLLHGGSLTGHSDGPGRGARFTMRLPLAASAAAPLEASAVNGLATRARKVVVVDDNVDAAESMSNYFELQGIEVAVAHDGRAALELLRLSKPDIAFIDLNMPGMDGTEVVRTLRAADAWTDATAFVAVTGMGRAEDVALTRQAGFDAHIVKPADLEVVSLLVWMTPEEVREWAQGKTMDEARPAT